MGGRAVAGDLIQIMATNVGFVIEGLDGIVRTIRANAPPAEHEFASMRPLNDEIPL